MKKLIILPKLYNCQGKLKKQWFIFYSVRDPKTDKMHRFRIYDGFTDLSQQEKYEHAKGLIEEYSARLRSGWTPFKGDQSIIYDNHIDYKTIADIYGSKREGNRTLRVILSKFLDFKKPGISISTFGTYCSKYRIFSIWTEKYGMQQNDISAYGNVIILRFFNYLINERKLSAKSVRKYSELLTAFFRFCMAKKFIKKNPVYGIPRCTRINDRTPRPIMRADIIEFKKKIVLDPELWLAVQFEFYCGLRPGHEVREMKIKEIDLVSGTIYVDRERAKSRTARVVTIPRQFLLYLRNVFESWLNAGVKLDREYFIFGKGGQPGPIYISKNKLGRKFNVIRKELNMPKEYTLYSWKHTAAVEVDQTLIPFKDLSRHCGHSSIGITDIYLSNKKPGLSVPIRDNYPNL
jgi:integrase